MSAPRDQQKDKDTDQKVQRLYELLLITCRQRKLGRAYGSLRLDLVWQDGWLKEFRVTSEDIFRSPEIP